MAAAAAASVFSFVAAHDEARVESAGCAAGKPINASAEAARRAEEDAYEAAEVANIFAASEADRAAEAAKDAEEA